MHTPLTSCAHHHLECLPRAATPPGGVSTPPVGGFQHERQRPHSLRLLLIARGGGGGSVASCRPVHLVASWHTAGHRCCICIRVSPDDSSYSWDISRVVQQGLQLGACVPVRPAPPPPTHSCPMGQPGCGVNSTH
jgi:hypothetical protein